MSETLIAGRILFIGAHCDDIEIGCGGTAAKFAQSGFPIAFAIATPENSDPKEDRNSSRIAEKDLKERKVEAADAAAVIGLSEANRNLFFGSFPDGELDQRYKELREWLKNVAKEFKPDT